MRWEIWLRTHAHAWQHVHQCVDSMPQAKFLRHSTYALEDMVLHADDALYR